MHLFSRHDRSTCMNTIIFKCMTHMTVHVPGSNLPISFFTLSLCMSSSKPNSFFSQYAIHTTNMDLNLACRTYFHAVLILCGDGHDLAYFVNDHRKLIRVYHFNWYSFCISPAWTFRSKFTIWRGIWRRVHIPQCKCIILWLLWIFPCFGNMLSK